MLLRITHETRYDYIPRVEAAKHVIHLEPRDTLRQKVLSHHVKVTPDPKLVCNQIDVFGNMSSFLDIQVQHDSLFILSESLVDTHDVDSLDPSLWSTSWETAREIFRYKVGARYEPVVEFVFASPHVPHHTNFYDYAIQSFSPNRCLHEAALELCNRIHSDFRYVSNSTNFNTNAMEAMEQRFGVCQDFAHVFIACCRSLGLAARYVSGYLLTQPLPGQKRLIGCDASHAWASVYVPDESGKNGYWLDCDPTNNRCDWEAPGPDYVIVAIGRDFSDVSPIRGFIHGGVNHTLSVAVTVEPQESD
jgi:transglutaminase-like putative cysteine protease